MASDDDSDVRSSSGSDDGDDAAASVDALRARLKANPYDYDAHVGLIQAYRRAARPDDVRHARERMRALFPLSEQLWTEYLSDERTLSAGDAAGRQRLLDLARAACRDYLSVSLWLLRCGLVVEEAGRCRPDSEAAERVRAEFEAAIMAGGLHVTEGVRLWEAYRDFELQLSARTPADERQRGRVASLYLRQLAVPLMDMDATLSSFLAWADNEALANDAAVRYRAAKAELDKRIEFERALEAAANATAAYAPYIDFERAHGDPARVCCLFERAIKDSPVDAALWAAYGQFATDVVQKVAADAVVDIWSRACRNCPWVHTLWIGQARAAERAGGAKEAVRDVFAAALSAGFAAVDSYVDVQLERIGYECRRGADSAAEDQLFEKAEASLAQLFGSGADASGRLLQARANAALHKWKDADKLVQIWDAGLADRARSGRADLWLRYARDQRQLRGAEAFRAVLLRALTKVDDDLDAVVAALTDFERASGTLDELERAATRAAKAVSARVARLQRKEAMQAEREKGKGRSEGAPKRARSPAAENAQADGPEAPHANRDVAASAAPRYHEHDPQKDAVTVFVSNLPLSVDEDRLRQVFGACGGVIEVRLVRDRRGRSRCYGYVEMDSEEAAHKARALDRTDVDDRPMYVSRCRPTKGAAAQAARAAVSAGGEDGDADDKVHFPDAYDPRIVFVTNLPRSVSRAALLERFGAHGDLRDARLPLMPAGHAKGFAYIEYGDAESAARAIAAENGSVMEGRTLRAAISNPQQAKQAGRGAARPAPHAAPGPVKPAVGLVPRAVKRQRLGVDAPVAARKA